MIGFGQSKFKNVKTKTNKKDVCPAPKNLFLYAIDPATACEKSVNNQLDIRIKNGFVSDLRRWSNSKQYDNFLSKIDNYNYFEVKIGDSETIKLSSENNFEKAITIDYDDNDKIYIRGFCNESISDSIKIHPGWCLPPTHISYKKEHLSQIEWIISRFLPSSIEYRGVLSAYPSIRYNILNDFEIKNNERFDFYTDKYLVPYSYKPVIVFSKVLPTFFGYSIPPSIEGHEEAIKFIASCLGVDGIIKESEKSSKLSRGTEIVNPLGVLLDNQPAVTQRIYTTKEDINYVYTLIIKDSSHQQVKDNLDKYDLLLKLAELKEKGIISEKEFQEEKKKLLEEK